MANDAETKGPSKPDETPQKIAKPGREGYRLLVNTRINPRGVATKNLDPATKRVHRFRVMPFQVVAVPFEMAVRMQRPARTSGGETSPTHPWSMFRYAELGYDLLPKGGRAPKTVADYLDRAVSLDELARYMDQADPATELNYAWEPRGYPTLTARQAKLIMTPWTYVHFRHIEGFAIYLRNEGGERNEGKPFVDDPDAVESFAASRVAHFKAELQRGSGVQAPRRLFPVSVKGVSAVR